ncbi:response regulator [Rhodocaloribacter sp.]
MDILLVEDEEAHKELIRRAFEIRGDQVALTDVATLEEARRRLARSLPDLAIIDLRLPDGDGIELLAMEGGMPLYPVIIMTSHGDEQVAVEAMKAGALDYVVKSEEMLIQMPRTVERVMSGWRHIVKRRRAEEALRESEVRFRGLFEHSPIAIWEADLSGVKTFLDLLPLDDVKDVPEYLEQHPEVLTACAQRVRLLGVNQAAVKMFEAAHAEELRSAFATGEATEKMSEAFKRELQALLRGETLIEFETTVRTLRGNDRDITFRWAVPPGHEGDYSRVLVSLVDITEQKRLEREILEISGREQRRIGSDLHDGLGQLLAGTRFKIAQLEKRLRSQEMTEEAEILAEVDQFVSEAMTQARALAQGLNPVTMEADGLAQALKGLAFSVERFTGVPCKLIAPEPVYIRDPEVATQVYRIAQEALNNAMRYSQATRFEVSLLQKGNTVTLSVRDNGIGIPETTPESGGIGLRIMKYRARMIEGVLDVRRHAEGGTLVTCHFLAASTASESEQSVF